MGFSVNWLSLLHAPEDIVEIRSIEPKPIISGYFRANSPAIQSELSRYPLIVRIAMVMLRYLLTTTAALASTVSTTVAPAIIGMNSVRSSIQKHTQTAPIPSIRL